MREFVARLLDWLRRGRLESELAEELRFHRDQLEREARADGAPAGEAARKAQRRLGNTVRVREDARELWSLPWLDNLQRDVRYALRGLRREPGFTLAVVITLGLGIGATTGMVGVVDRLMFRAPLHLREPGQVHRVYLQMAGRERDIVTHVFPYAQYLDLQRWTSSFSRTAAFHSVVLAVGSGEATREHEVAVVSASLFDFFDIRPALGRFFTEAEDTPPIGARVVVLSHAFWMAAYAGRDVIGEVIHVGNIPSTIIGVAPAGFTGVTEGEAPAVFLPMTTFGHFQGGSSRADYFQSYEWDWAEMIVRRKPGVTVMAATNDLTNAFARSRAVARARHAWMPRTERAAQRATAGSLRTAAGPDPGLEARTLMWLTAVAVIVLLIAYANVANLFLSRALRRRREVALRLALGVSRRRLLAQSFTETMVLSLIACGAGVAMAAGVGSALHRMVIADGSRFSLWNDWRSLGVAIGAAVLAALLTALAPVAFAAAPDINATLRSGARQGSYQHSRRRGALLVVQTALSVVLLIGGALFVRSLGNVRKLPLGYEADRLLLVRVESRGTTLSEAERAALRERMLERALAIPGVEDGAWVSNVPFRGSSTLGLAIPGIDSVPLLGRFDYQTAGPAYFATMGTRIVRGRPFSDADRAGAPMVAVVSEGMAARIWPGQDALNRCMHIGGWNQRPDTMPCTTVVGVAEDAVYDPVADRPFRYYLPVEQFPQFGASLLVLRATADPVLLVNDVSRAFQRVMPGRSYVTVRPARDRIDEQRRSWRVGATLFAGFGALALLVAAVGLYGVVAYNVAQRMPELGVRIALGAHTHHVVWLVIGQGLRFALAGVALGSALALAAAPWIEPLLFRQSARDPALFGLVSAVLVAIALLASAVPAMHATRAHPATVLRGE